MRLMAHIVHEWINVSEISRISIFQSWQRWKRNMEFGKSDYQWQMAIKLRWSGVCLDRITHKCLEYEFDNTTKEDIIEYCRRNSIDVDKISKLHKKAGGETDIMIGIQYQKYFPVEVLRLPSGLTSYESKFVGIDGTRGLISGPHPCFTATEARYGNQHKERHIIMLLYMNWI